MDDLNWFVKHRFQEAIRYEFSWAFVFDGGISVTVQCLWRLVEDGRIRISSQDDGHRFGLPAPVDCVLEINQRLAGAAVASVVLREGTLDLEICFDSGQVLQIIPDSPGYESWNAQNLSHEFIAIGGGDLACLKKTSAD